MRYVVKLRRRRECKTDYMARRNLIKQDCNKYETAKYRFVARITNKDVICQIIRAKETHDEVLCAAYAHELKKYGLTVGLTNYAACYATGLLCARRLLKNLGLDSFFTGVEEVDGELFTQDFYKEDPEDEEGGRAPFLALLDVGLRRTTKGSRVFACMKGAVDGGVEIPHNEKRFPGYGRTAEEDMELDASQLKDRIFGKHVAQYMEKMKGEDEKKYASHFSKYVAAGLGPEDLEDKYAEVHAAIRKDPSAKKAPPCKRRTKKIKKASHQERMNRVFNKIKSIKIKHKIANE